MDICLDSSVIVTALRKYEQMKEDLYDLAVIAERRNEKTFSFEEFKRKL